MPETRELVANTGPLIAVIAAMGDLKILDSLYGRVVVPFEVCQEILTHSTSRYGAGEFEAAEWLEKRSEPTETHTFLRSSLDSGEAAVIQLALKENIDTVCIDEGVGRRVARLNGLKVTGSLGILIRAKNEGHSVSISEAIERMVSKGIHLSDRLIRAALKQAGEE